MGSLVKGDVVIVPFPFSDLSSAKKRPGLVLAAPKDDELIICQITSQNSRSEYAIEITDDDIENGALNRDICYIRPNHMFMADPIIVDKFVGKLISSKLQEVIDEAINILRNK